MQEGCRHRPREAATAGAATHSRSRPRPWPRRSGSVGDRRERLRLDPPGADGRDREGCNRTEPHYNRADPERRSHSIDERLAGLVAPLAGEDRGKHGDTEHAAELADRVVRAGGLALLLPLDG